MRTNTKNQIIDFIAKNSEATPSQLQRHLGISPQALHRHLSELLQAGVLRRLGKPPRVLYQVVKKLKPPKELQISQVEREFIQQRYVYISPQGKILRGLDGFSLWAENTQQAKYMSALATEFVKVRKENDRFFNDFGLVNATEKFKTTFSDSSISEVFYSDFYSLPKFGKTPLGALVLHAKQAQDRKLIQQIAAQCRDHLERLIEARKIDALAWAPHSIPRKLPFLNELKSQLGLSLPELIFFKAYEGEVPVAQKSLSKLEERIQNANSTIFLKSPKFNYKHILIIDDAVGSGATLEAMAAKVKARVSNTKISGYAIVGSLKGFEVIKEI